MMIKPDTTQIVMYFLQEQDIAAISRRQYKSNLKKFFEWVADQGKQYWQLRTSDIIRYKEYLQKYQRTSLTIANYLVTLRLFFRWCDRNDFCKDVTNSIRINKSYKTFKKKSLKVQQCKVFLSKFETETLKGKRDYAIVNLLLRNGLREIEVVRMNINDITEHQGSVAIAIQRKGKFEKDTLLPLSEEAKQSIEDYLADRKGWSIEDPLFVSFSNNSKMKRITTAYLSTMIKSKLTEAGLTGSLYTAHSLRHTTASLLIAAGYSEYEVQTFMGHANFQTTQIYTRQRQMDLIFNKKPTNYFDNEI